MNDILASLPFKALSAIVAISSLFLLRDLFFPSAYSASDERNKVGLSYRQKIGKSIDDLLGFFRLKH